MLIYYHKHCNLSICCNASNLDSLAVNIISKNEQFIDMLGSMAVIRRDDNQ